MYSTIKNVQVASLVEECYRDNDKGLESEICFVVFGDIDITERGVKNALVSMDPDKVEVDLSGTKNAIKIKFDAVEYMIKVTS